MLVKRKATEGTKSVGNGASIEVLAANERRQYALITNSSANGLWLSHGGTAVIGTGVYVPANGGSYEIDADNMWRGAINGIASAGAANVIGTLDLE